MASLNGTNIASPIKPFTTDDTYATHEASYGKGGHRTVNNIDERNSIPYSRRELLMTVAVISENCTYKLITNPVNSDVTTDKHWQKVIGYEDIIISEMTPDFSSTILLTSSKDYYKTINISDATITLESDTQYGKIVWCLEITTDTLPSLTFANSIYWRYDNDLELTTNSYVIFEFETWDSGSIWLGKTSKHSFTTPENFITETDLNDKLSWSSV